MSEYKYSVSYIPTRYNDLPVRFHKLIPDAEDPWRERPSSVGWDLTLVRRDANRVEDNVGEENLFGTGLTLAPPPGYVIELLPTSDLTRAGYMLAQSPLQVHPEDRSEVMVPLYKFREGDDLELPMRGVQMVLRKAEYFLVNMVTDMAGSTVRGDVGGRAPRSSDLSTDSGYRRGVRRSLAPVNPQSFHSSQTNNLY